MEKQAVFSSVFTAQVQLKELKVDLSIKNVGIRSGIAMFEEEMK